MQHVEQRVLGEGEFGRILERITSREEDPYHAASGVMARATAAPPGRLDHTGIAVKDAAEYVALFERLFGLRTSAPEDVGRHRVRFIETGDSTLELVEPLAPDSPVAAFLEKRGAGLHHVCVRVPDIRATLAALKAQGVRLVDEEPRPGAHGSLIAFLHPSSALGLLIEIKETVK
jgi:methylmalonyl-CoA epimerase